MTIQINGIEMKSSTKHPDYYFSKDGRFAYSLAKKCGMFLKVKTVEKGYKKINYIDGKRNVGLHVLVWEAWKGLIPKGNEIHHKDKNPSNNDLSNLICLTRKEHLDLHKDDQVSKKRRHEARLGKPSGMIGKKHSPETIKKMKAKAANRKKDPLTGRFIKI